MTTGKFLVQICLLMRSSADQIGNAIATQPDSKTPEGAESHCRVAFAPGRPRKVPQTAPPPGASARQARTRRPAQPEPNDSSLQARASPAGPHDAKGLLHIGFRSTEGINRLIRISDPEKARAVTRQKRRAQQSQLQRGKILHFIHQHMLPGEAFVSPERNATSHLSSKSV